MGIDWDGYYDPPDHPDDPECPECDDGAMVYDPKIELLKCDTCGHEMPIPEQEEKPEDFPEIDPEPHRCRECGTPTECIYCADCADKCKCPHGRIISDGCGDCDAESDRAFDAAREARFR